MRFDGMTFKKAKGIEVVRIPNDVYCYFSRRGVSVGLSGHSLTNMAYGLPRKRGDRYFTTVYLAYDGYVYTHSYQCDEKGKRLWRNA